MFDSLTCAYGPATEVPGLLAALSSADRDRRAFARAELGHMLVHHGAKFEASVAAVPYLVEILTAPAGAGRTEAYELLALISDNGQLPRHRTRASGATLGELTRDRFRWRLARRPASWQFDTPEEWEGSGWEVRAYEAVGAALTAYVSLLGDPDPRLRIAAAHLVAAHPSPAAVPALTAQLAAETSPRAAASLCVAAGQCGEPGDEALITALTRWRDHPDGLTHLSALMGLAQLLDSPDEPLLTTLAACTVRTDEEPAGDWPFHGDTATGATWALESLSPVDNPALTGILLDLVRNHHAKGYYYNAVELLLGMLFPAGPLPDDARYADLTDPQRELVRLTISHALLDEDPMPSAFAGANLPAEEVSLAFWAEL